MKKDIKSVMDIKRNNLSDSSSPYLLQHAGNPVWWQEWSSDVLRYAANENKPILVSVGYATCHWCHVMAAEAFSDEQTAAYLNENFICIKVDREQRPDIDQFMMDFINRQNGRGGWPLNVFLTPAVNPVFALTYAPAVSSESGYSFFSIAEKVFAYIKKNIDIIPAFKAPYTVPAQADENKLIESLSVFFDQVNGGFGNGQKFPSHSTLLYLLYQLTITDNQVVRTICSRTLDAMRMRGLNDHLQGGIFRYCVDREWTIPHFEKMLYDQAMALWTYSLAYRVIGNDEFRAMAVAILKCMDESFLENGLYITAHDADTDHKEGATYLWSYKQLRDLLDHEEFVRFSKTYEVEAEGNFDGLNHLLKMSDLPVPEIEAKLLAIRRERPQPDRDDKIISGLNALIAIALIQAGRLLDMPELADKAASLVRKIMSVFWDGKTLGHSFRNGILQKQGFLSDAASLLTAVSMLYEEDKTWGNNMTELTVYVESFREGEKWLESGVADFQPVYASWFDHPVPSGVSMAEFGLTRAALLTGGETSFRQSRVPFQSDFYNIAAMLSNGFFHAVTSKKPIPWSQLPVNSIQLRGETEQDCFMGICTLRDKT